LLPPDLYGRLFEHRSRVNVLFGALELHVVMREATIKNRYFHPFSERANQLASADRSLGRALEGGRCSVEINCLGNAFCFWIGVVKIAWVGWLM
jgi:hypothetical protein